MVTTVTSYLQCTREITRLFLKELPRFRSKEQPYIRRSYRHDELMGPTVSEKSLLFREQVKVIV